MQRAAAKSSTKSCRCSTARQAAVQGSIALSRSVSTVRRWALISFCTAKSRAMPCGDFKRSMRISRPRRRVLVRFNAMGDQPCLGNARRYWRRRSSRTSSHTGRSKSTNRAATCPARDRWCCKLDSTSSAAFQSPRHAGSNRACSASADLGVTTSCKPATWTMASRTLFLVIASS